MQTTSAISIVSLIVLTAVLIAATEHQSDGFQQVTHASGGSMLIETPGGRILNEGTSLEREWTAVHDENLPVSFVGTPGVDVSISGRGSRSHYHFRAAMPIEVDEPLAAIEIRFILFDYWGDHLRTLTYRELSDIDEGEHELHNSWSVRRLADIRDYHASIAYISRVRTADGRVIKADPAPVLEQVLKYDRDATRRALNR